jgi:hypothetical protein
VFYDVPFKGFAETNETEGAAQGTGRVLKDESESALHPYTLPSSTYKHSSSNDAAAAAWQDAVYCEMLQSR